MTTVEYRLSHSEQKVIPCAFEPVVAGCLEVLGDMGEPLYLRGGTALLLAMERNGLDVGVLTQIRQFLPSASVQTQFLDVDNVWQQPIFAPVDTAFTSVQPDIDLAVAKGGFGLLEAAWPRIAHNLNHEVFVPAQNPNIKILKASNSTLSKLEPQKLEITCMDENNFRFSGCNTDLIMFSVSEDGGGYNFEEIGATPKQLEVTPLLQGQMMQNNPENFGKIIACLSRGIRQALALQIEIPSSFVAQVEAWAARVYEDRGQGIFANYDTLLHNASLAECVHREWLVATALYNNQLAGAPFGEMSPYEVFSHGLGLDKFTELKAFCELAAGPVALQSMSDVQQKYGQGNIFA